MKNLIVIIALLWAGARASFAQEETLPAATEGDTVEIGYTRPEMQGTFLQLNCATIMPGDTVVELETTERDRFCISTDAEYQDLLRYQKQLVKNYPHFKLPMVDFAQYKLLGFRRDFGGPKRVRFYHVQPCDLYFFNIEVGKEIELKYFDNITWIQVPANVPCHKIRFIITPNLD